MSPFFKTYMSLPNEVPSLKRNHSAGEDINLRAARPLKWPQAMENVMQATKEKSVETCNSLEPIDINLAIDKLKGKEEVHTFLGYGLMGCDIQAEKAIQYVKENGAWRANESFGGYTLDHQVATIDRYGYIILLDITI